MTKTLKLAVGSLVVGVVVLALKSLAYWMTGSIALFSDALESTVNVVTAVAVLVAVWLAGQPANANHPYGHHKAEYFSAVLEGVLIIVAALMILREAYLGFVAPRELDPSAMGLAVNAAAALINAFWSWVLIREGRRLRSPALAADGRHLLADVVTSLGVLAGLLLVPVTGLQRLDPALAALVALNILWSGWGLMKASIGGLMDEAVPHKVLGQNREVIARTAEGALQAH